MATVRHHMNRPSEVPASEPAFVPGWTPPTVCEACGASLAGGALAGAVHAVKVAAQAVHCRACGIEYRPV